MTYAERDVIGGVIEKRKGKVMLFGCSSEIFNVYICSFKIGLPPFIMV